MVETSSGTAVVNVAVELGGGPVGGVLVGDGVELVVVSVGGLV